MPKPKGDWSTIPVKELGLSTRAFNAVTRGAGCKTIGELAAKSDAELRWCPGMGPGSLAECRAAVRRFLTERGFMGDVANALIRAMRDAGCHDMTQSDAIATINALGAEGWEIRRV